MALGWPFGFAFLAGLFLALLGLAWLFLDWLLLLLFWLGVGRWCGLLDKWLLA